MVPTLRILPVWMLVASAVLLVADSWGQCSACEADPACSSDNGFPTLCPAALPAATVGVFYEETITFFLPAEVVDPGSGVTADLNSVTITGITGVPLGMQVELDDDDSVYYPTSGQTLGCANICGSPLLPGTFDMVINISAVASAFGIEQVVTDSFPYQLVVEAGEGGSATFTFSPPTGCDSLWANFNASLSGSGNQISTYDWDFGNGQTGSSATVDSVAFPTTGAFNVTLTTTISDQLLNTVTLSTTAGGGWDDGWSPSPDPYFVLSDASGNNVYTSSVANESYSTTWNGVNVVLANPPYTLTFYDEDLFPDDDYLGAMSIDPDGPGTFDLNADPSYGTFTISLQTAVSTTDTSEVVVNASPEITVAWAEGGDTLVASGNDLIAYDWFWGDSLVASGIDSIFVPLENGWYSAVGTSSSGCSAATDSMLFCASDAVFGLNLSLGELPEVVVADGNFASYVWTFNGVASDTTEINFWNTDVSGWYGAQAWDDYGCPWSADSVLVCWPLNPPIVSEDDGGLLTVMPEYAYYQWWLNGEPIPGATAGQLQNAGPGLYAVSVTDFEDCPGVISDDWVVVDIVEPAGASADLTWRIYPNPASDQVQLMLPEGTGPCTIWAFGLDGKLTQTLTVETNGAIDIADWPSGVHLLKAQSQRTQARLPTLRLVKQ